MPLLKFKISWNEDDSTYRNREILSSQSFFEFHTAIKKCFELPNEMQANFHIIDSRGKISKTISSTVEKNLRDAPALSMKKTPVGALVQDPEQTFQFECIHPKAWKFFVEIITINPDNSQTDQYPKCTKSEGLSPIHYGIKIEDNPIADILNQFDELPDDEDFDEEMEDLDKDQIDE